MTLCQADRSTLLIIDPQERLMPAIHDGDGVVRRCVQLATAARELRIPVIGTEENPDGLGPNVAAVRTLCDTHVRQVLLLRGIGAGVSRAAAGRARDAGRRRLRGARLRDADGRPPARGRPAGEVGQRRRRVASCLRSRCRDRTRARTRRRHRDDRDGRLRMARDLPSTRPSGRCSSWFAERAARTRNPTPRAFRSRRRPDRGRGPPSAHGRSRPPRRAAPRSSSPRARPGRCHGRAAPMPRDAARSAPSRCRCRPA